MLESLLSLNDVNIKFIEFESTIQKNNSANRRGREEDELVFFPVLHVRSFHSEDYNCMEYNLFVRISNSIIRISRTQGV